MAVRDMIVNLSDAGINYYGLPYLFPSLTIRRPLRTEGFYD